MVMTPSWEAEEDAIMARFLANTTLTAAKVDGTAAANTEPFRPPAADKTDPASSLWARLQVVSVPGAVAPLSGVTGPERVGLGPTAKTYWRGLVWISLFTPRGAGDNDLRALVDASAAIFHRESFSTNPTIHCEDAQRPERLADADPDLGEWYGVKLIIPFWTLS